MEIDAFFPTKDRANFELDGLMEIFDRALEMIMQMDFDL
jgi:hypothetical protein